MNNFMKDLLDGGGFAPIDLLLIFITDYFQIAFCNYKV